MRAAALSRTVKRLAGWAGGTGPCPCCADWRGPVLLRGDLEAQPGPPCCPACGRPPAVCRLIKVDNFYHNRERLLALERGEED
jgi:hypothetical protein